MRKENYELRRANETLKAASVFFRDRARHRPNEVTAFIDEHRGRFGVEPICRVLDVSASAYYERKKGPPSPRAIEDARLLAIIEEAHERNYGAYGYRKMWPTLRRSGIEVGRDRVKRLMRTHGIKGAKRRGKPWRTTTPDPSAARPPDLVDRDFTAEAPNRLWLADFPYLRCWEGVVFFSFVIDAFSRRIVGWQFSTSMRTDLVLDALRMALTRREPGADVELIHHSCLPAGPRRPQGPVVDRVGRRRLRHSFENARSRCCRTGLTPAYDLAARHKTELIADRVWRTRSQLELAIVEWVAWFNNERLHEPLGDLPPAEFETLSQTGYVQITTSQ